MGGHGLAHVMLWVGMGGHRLLLMGCGLDMSTNWKEMLGSVRYRTLINRIVHPLCTVFARKNLL